MNKVFELIDVSDEQVVIKVNAKDNLAVAMNPYISGDYDYITVTRGEHKTLTIIKKDGTTFSFSWGGGSSTIIRDNLERLKAKVVEFIYDNNVLLNLNTSTVLKASIFYNNNYGQWQLSVNDRLAYLSYTAKSADEMINETKRFINCTEWIKGTAPTGIDIWKAVLTKEERTIL